MRRQYLIICILLFALLAVMTFILFVILAQAHLSSPPYYLYTPTPNIYK